MATDELLPGPADPDDSPPGRIYAGTFVDDAADADDEPRVALLAEPGGQALAMPFMPRGAVLPQAGDRAWVGVDDDGRPMVVAWKVGA